MNNAFIPIEAIPPGEFLQEELDARGWTQEDLAAVLGISRRQVINLLQGKSGVTPETAIALGQALDQDPRTWLNLQAMYELAKARITDRRISDRARLFAKAPIREMIRRGWLPDTDDVGVLTEGTCSLLQISSLDETPCFQIAARKSTEYGMETAAQLAWYGRAMQLAAATPAKPFDLSRLGEGIRSLVRLAASSVDVKQVPRLLQKLGVALVLVENLKGSKIDGAAFWIGDKPVVAMSLRFDRMDYFWFTLIHELVHIQRQDISPVDVDWGTDDDADLPEMERIANETAAKHLIPTDQLESFIRRKRPFYTRESLVQFADAMRVHPCIVIGQLQKRKELSYAQFRGMLPRVREQVIRETTTDGWGHCVRNDTGASQ